MEPRKLLVSQFKKFLEQAKNEADQPNVDQGQEYYYNLEAQLTFTEFERVISEIEKTEEHDVKQEDIDILRTFLDTRWERVRSTDAQYVMRPNSAVNNLCIQAARYAHENLSGLDIPHHREMLMPTVLSWKGELDKDLARNTHLHELLLTDDDKYLIEVGAALTSRSALRRQEYHMTQSHRGTRHELTDEETKRLVNHSKLSLTLIESMNAWDADEKAVAKQALLKGLSRKDYAGHTVQSSYGRDGYELLKDCLMQSINDLFVTREQLFSYFSAKLYREEWAENMSRLSDETLDRLVNPENDLRSAVTATSAMYTGRPKYDKAVLYCLAETYWRQRKDQPAYTGYAGRLAGGYAAYSKEQKEESITAIKDYITSLRSKDPIKLEDWRSFVESSCKDLAGPIKDGTVGRITAQFAIVDDIYTKAHTHESSHRPV